MDSKHAKALAVVAAISGALGAVLGSGVLARVVSKPQQSESAHLNFCDLLENADKYDGQRVTVDAYYSYFFEVSLLLCWECFSRANLTWLEIDSDLASKKLRKAPKGSGVISGRFTGVFHAGGGPYGMGQYRNKFDLDDISDIRVVIRDKTAVSEKTCSCSTLVRKGLRAQGPN